MTNRFLLTIAFGMLSACVLLGDDQEKKANPEATKVLAEARRARASWTKFPGLTADMTVTINGKTEKGILQVSEKGKVTISELPEDMVKWTKPILSSAISHRLSAEEESMTPCTFADNDANNPLGRLIQVMGDEMGSSYRIRDKQIMMVNRKMGDIRFSITMQENLRNEDGKFIPRSYSVHYWDAKTGELTKTESHHQAWTRQQGFDLPSLIRVITVDKNVDSREVALTNIKLR